MRDDDYPITDPEHDPRLNDDAQPSITDPAEALALADANAGPPVPARELDELEGEPAPEGDEPEDEDPGTGPYEGRTVAQLRAVARSKGLAVSGSKDELVARLRG